jgi:hypothetical protein
MPEEKIEIQEIKDNERELSPKNSKKDFWLFLIFIDIIAICVFGFFAYTSFFENVNSKSAQTPDDAKPIVEEVIVEDIKYDVNPAPAQSSSQPLKNNSGETLQENKPQPQQAPEKITDEPAKPKKQSVFISGTGKTRKVLFKYFGNAKQAAVVSGFTGRKPIAMKKTGDEWQASVIIYPGEYRYMYVIDGKEIPNPNAEQSNGKSVLIVK